jgi:hypothetical protein
MPPVLLSRRRSIGIEDVLQRVTFATRDIGLGTRKRTASDTVPIVMHLKSGKTSVHLSEGAAELRTRRNPCLSRLG